MALAQIAPLRILLSAYACEPGRGSEPGIGWQWAVALVARGHEVWVLTRANNQNVIASEREKLPAAVSERLHFIYSDLPAWASWWKKGGRGVQLYYALWQRHVLPVARAAHEKHQFDLVHHLTFGVWRHPTHLHKLGLPVIFGPVGGGETAPGPLIKTLRWPDQIQEQIRILANDFTCFRPSLRLCLRQCRWIVAKTPETLSYIEKAGGHGCISLEVGIDAAKFQPTDRRRGNNQLRCLFAGRLIGWKGVHLAIAAVAESRKDGCAISLTIVGKGPTRTHLGMEVERLGLQEHITFIDWLTQEALFEQYRQHDVLLFPSLHDSSGNVILEAFAHGLPAVCLKLGGPGELVDDTCGFAVDAHDRPVRRLADALVALAANPATRAKLGESARAKALGMTWQAAVATIYEPVEQLLSYSDSGCFGSAEIEQA